MGISSGTSTGWRFIDCVQIELEFRNVRFWGEGKIGVPKETPSRSKHNNQQQTKPTSDAESGNQTWATFVGSKCSHYCAIPAPLTYEGVDIFIIGILAAFIQHFCFKYSCIWFLNFSIHFVYCCFTSDGNEAHSKNYHLLSADLREISVLESKLNEIGIDKR